MPNNECSYLHICCRTLQLPEIASNLALEEDFELAGYGIDALTENERLPRIVRIGAIQNKIALSTAESVTKQV
jgi:beta-ureidopropionase